MVSCPHCRSLLRCTKPIPAGVNLRCPDCKVPFLAPDVSKPTLFGPPFIIAVTVSLLLGASIIAAALVLTTRRPGPVAQDQARPDEDLVRQRRELADAKAGLDEQKRKLEHARLLVRAQDALGKDDHALAKKLFAQALDLVPGDADTVKGLAAAEAGLLVAANRQKDRSKRQAELEQLLADAKQALADRKYALAVQRLEAARAVAATNRTVLDLLAEAQTALDSDTAEKKKLADFRAHMDSGRAALKAERYTDAVKEYLAALRLMPDDLEAQQGQKQAEARLAAQADKDKRQNAFAALADRGQKALKGKRFKEAIQALEAALRLIPDDREAQRDLREAKADLARVKKGNPSLLARADEAVKLGRLTDARQLCEEAVADWAEDRQAEKALRNVDRLVENARTAQTTYLARVQAAQLAYAAGNYAQAVAAYAEAAQLMPTDLEVARALRQARRALERQVAGRLEIDRLVRAGNGALLARSFDSAITSFNKALRIDPDNVAATQGLNRARYGKGMSDGQMALARRRRDDAIEAFTTALEAKPGDALASNGLRQARMLR
jgi:tetratricopeptide (TPR) repeat protein